MFSAPTVTMTGSPVTVTMTTLVTTSTCVSTCVSTTSLAGAAISKPFLTIGEATAYAAQREAIAIEERILIDVYRGTWVKFSWWLIGISFAFFEKVSNL